MEKNNVMPDSDEKDSIPSIHENQDGWIFQQYIASLQNDWWLVDWEQINNQNCTKVIAREEKSYQMKTDQLAW